MVSSHSSGIMAFLAVEYSLQLVIAKFLCFELNRRSFEGTKPYMLSRFQIILNRT